jgi:hypothetical protein
MTPTVRQSIAVAVLHVSIVASLGATLVVDRATRPRVWARTAPADPNLPIRGRYVRLRIEADPDGDAGPAASAAIVPVKLSVHGERLVATRISERGGLAARYRDRNGEPRVILQEPLAYFIRDNVPDPSIRKPGEELWVEVTIPRAGPPRPIRLGVKRNGVLTPLDME